MGEGAGRERGRGGPPKGAAEERSTEPQFDRAKASKLLLPHHHQSHHHHRKSRITREQANKNGYQGIK